MEGEGNVRNNRDLYIDADSPGALCFPETVRFIKFEPALAGAPVVPSQATFYPSYSMQQHAAPPNYDQSGQNPYSSSSVAATRVDTDMVMGAGESASYADTEGYADTAGSTSQVQQGAVGRQNEVEVEVTRVRHTIRRDEFVFERKGRQQSSTEDDWVKGKLAGRTVWFYRHGKRTTYWTKKLG